MRTKRFILMLLVMLMSVAGAWAQEPTKLRLTYVDVNDEEVIYDPENAFDGDLTNCTCLSFVNFDSDLPNRYITFKTEFPVRVDQLSIHYSDQSPYLTEFELRGLNIEGGNWDTQSTSMLQKTNLGEPYRDRDLLHGPFNITCNSEDRYQYFRIMFNAASGPYIDITEIELYVTCDHSYPTGTNVCSKCGYKVHEHVYSSDWSYDKDGHWQACSGTVGICNSPRRNYASHSSGLTCSVCGMPHCHQLDGAGSCRVDGCGYSVSSISQDLFEAQETYGGSNSSSFNNLGKLFDGNTDTKWQAVVTATAIFKTQTPVRIDGYSFHSVDGDYFSPHPKSWTLYGYDETANTWQIVHSVADASPSNGWNNYRFINNDGPLYSYYKLEITELQNDHPYCKTNIGGLTLDIRPVAEHIHRSSSEWYSDNFGHWHKCEGEGLCSEPKRDYAVHQINGGLSCICGLQHSHQLNNADGKCSVSGCNYILGDVPSEFISSVNEYGGSTSTGASVGNLFDGNTDTKWRSGLKGTAIFKTQVPVRINGYSYHSETDDIILPHPKSWTLYGYDETASAWQIVHSVADASPSNGWNNYRFLNNNGPHYSYFKLEITELQDDHPACNTNIGGLILDIEPVAGHTHISSSEWYLDNFGHWHKCVGEGLCLEQKRDYSSHQFNGGLSCVCGLQHSHQLNVVDGRCNVSGCGYSVDDIPSGFISSVNEYGGSISTEDASVGNLFDGNTDTKWQAGLTATAIFKTQTPVRIDGYSFHSVGDYYYLPHPKSWTLYGYDETANTWQIVHSVIDASPSNGWNNYRFINNDGPHYSYFKIEVTELQNGHPNSNTNIGGLTLDIIHEHNYADSWSSDDTHHWHECTSELGKCNNPRVQEGEHVYDNTATAGTEPYYTCSICGHIDPVRQHVHHYVASEVTTEGHVRVCTSEVGECTVPEIRGGHTLEVVDGTYVCSLCGWTHEHNYMWIHDETKHWHECDGEGECNARTKDEAEHNIHESITCDTDNYMCDVCKYVDEEKKAQFGADRDYLSMTAVGGDVKIGFKKVGSPASYTIQVSEDGNIWSERQTLTESTTKPLATIPEGKTCYFRHGTTEIVKNISRDHNNYWSFTMTGDGTIEADGNIISLIDATCQKNSLAGSPQHVFTGLFSGCESLTVAPQLPFNEISQFCYYHMFEGTGISVAPELPATIIPDGAYMGMFLNCKNMERVSPLPGIKLRRRAYEEMFNGCEKLTSVQIANITSMDERTDAGNACFTNWLKGTAANTNGKVIAPIEMMGHALVFLPSNWQWATKLKANEDPDNDGNFYTTFFDSRYDYKVENGFKAYSGIITTTEGDERELRLTATPNNIIPKDHGVIIHGGSDEVLLTVSDGSAERVDGNVLTGSDTDTTAPANCYIMSYGQNGLGFYRYEDGKALSAHKAYLIYEPHAAQANALRMVFAEDEVDGIESISSDSANSPIGIYSVSGVRLNNLQKGINIVNGKKIIVK